MSDVGSTESPRSEGTGFAGAGAGISRTGARVLDDVELYTRIYRQMLLIRGFEELVQSLFLKGEVHGTYNPFRERLVFLAILSPAVAPDPAIVDVSGQEPWSNLRAGFPPCK